MTEKAAPKPKKEKRVSGELPPHVGGSTVEAKRETDAAPAAPTAPAAKAETKKIVRTKHGTPLIGRTYRAVLPLLFVLSMFAGSMSGCEAVEKFTENAQVCVEYKGRRVCVGRENGKWTIYANVTPEEEKEILGALER